MNLIFRATQLIAMAAAAIVSAASGHAADVFGQEFRLNNAVNFGPSWIQLTRSDATFYRASAFATKPLGLGPSISFEVKLGFRILGGAGGADGMALAFVSSGPDHLGQAGGNLGFYGVSGGDGKPLPFGPAYAVAIDTYRNADYGDQGNNHVSTLDSSTYQLRRTTAAPYTLNGGAEC